MTLRLDEIFLLTMGDNTHVTNVSGLVHEATDLILGRKIVTLG